MSPPEKPPRPPGAFISVEPNIPESRPLKASFDAFSSTSTYTSSPSLRPLTIST